MRGEHIQFDEKTRNNFRDQFAARAGQLGLHDIVDELEEDKADMFPSIPVPFAATTSHSSYTFS